MRMTPTWVVYLPFQLITEINQEIELAKTNKFIAFFCRFEKSFRSCLAAFSDSLRKLTALKDHNCTQMVSIHFLLHRFSVNTIILFSFVA